MIRKGATHRLKAFNQTAAKPEVTTETAWLIGPLAIHAVIMGWLISLIY